ncbi:lysoplasmalogenase [Algoriphagus boritolerans]|uniref:lysoplasmalogenase n=1 Tax=Algoriphagus boritolerans TaxID=308111 RepID=UPI002FCE0802
MLFETPDSFGFDNLFLSDYQANSFHSFDKIHSIGLDFFSWIGDILLLWPQLFVYGLGAFFMAQICYIIGFKLAQRGPNRLDQVNFIKLFFFNLPIYLTAAFTFYLINPNLGSMKIPVILYLIVIVSMVATARDRFKKCNPASFWQVFIGGLFFFISDGTIAISRFFYGLPGIRDYHHGNLCHCTTSHCNGYSIFSN